MSSGDGAGTFTRAEVIRGMHVESLPLRLVRPGRANPGTAGDVVPDAGRKAAEEAQRRGYQEGVERGHAAGLQAGYEEGQRQGVADAKLQARATLDKAVAAARAPLAEREERLDALTASIGTAMLQCLGAAEDELVALCYETIARVLGDAAVRPAAVRAQWEHLASLCKSSHLVSLHVHPQDAALLEEDAAPKQGAADGGQGLVRWVPDAEVALGGCVVVAKGGGLDARLETILDACKAALLQARARRAHAPVVEEGS